MPAGAAGREFTGTEDVATRLGEVDYLADDAIATVVYLAQRLSKPVLAEGPAGVGKTELAKAVAAARGAELVRLQCYEGLDEAKALYEWNYRKQLLRIQAAQAVGRGPVATAEQRGDGEHAGSMDDDGRSGAWAGLHDDIFSEDYLLERPLLRALRHPGAAVLLVDEVDKVDVEFEALLLEILADHQVTIPEMGTVTGTRRPFVVLTSNNTRELSEALKRRCLYLYLDYPTVEREKQIVLTRVPDIPEVLAEQLARVVRSLRQLELRKPPSISETIDWARTLLELGYEHVDEDVARTTMTVLLKHQADLDRAEEQLSVPTSQESPAEERERSPETAS